MKTLYLVGNGFDCHHKLPTSYKEYRDLYKDDINKLLCLLTISNDMVDWSDFENEIGRITDEFITNSADIDDTDGLYELELLLMKVMKINLYKWIKSIDKDISNYQKSDFFFDDTDCFVTFNYTHVLEDIYKIKDSQILHIHGDCRNVDEELINEIFTNTDHLLGKDIKTHIESSIISNDIKLGTKDMGTYDLACVFENKNENLAEILRDISNIICKEDEFEICKEKLVHFLGNREIDKVCIVGNNYSGIDKYYYEKFLYENFSDRHWIVYVYSEDDKDIYNQILCKKIEDSEYREWPRYKI